MKFPITNITNNMNIIDNKLPNISSSNINAFGVFSESYFLCRCL